MIKKKLDTITIKDYNLTEDIKNMLQVKGYDCVYSEIMENGLIVSTTMEVYKVGL